MDLLSDNNNIRSKNCVKLKQYDCETGEKSVRSAIFDINALIACYFFIYILSVLFSV